VLSYGNKAVSVQAHPEFDAGFIKGLFDAREAVLPPQIRARKNDDLSGELSSPTIARMMADVLKRKSQ
jgi:hypothetical protein